MFKLTGMEWMIVIGIVGILVVVALVSTERTRCIEGYKFAVAANGVLTQIMDSSGSAIGCKE